MSYKFTFNSWMLKEGKTRLLLAESSFLRYMFIHSVWYIKFWVINLDKCWQVLYFEQILTISIILKCLQQSLPWRRNLPIVRTNTGFYFYFNKEDFYSKRHYICSLSIVNQHIVNVHERKKTFNVKFPIHGNLFEEYMIAKYKTNA